MAVVDQRTSTTDGDRQEAAAAQKLAGEKVAFRLATVGAVLVVVVFAGYGVGRLNSRTATPATPAAATAGGWMPGMTAATEGGGMPGMTAATKGGGMPGMTAEATQRHAHNADGSLTPTGVPAGAPIGGLSLSSGGLTLVPARTTFLAGRSQRLTFRITGAGGAPVTTYAVVHDKLLHLVVIRRDLADYQHLHPAMAPDGTWSVDLTLAAPGTYRMIADFAAVTGGHQIAITLGADLNAAGMYVPRPLPAPVRAVSTGGFTVGYEGSPGTESTQPILIGVTGADRKPAPLEPYLGAFGHLVMLRLGDLGYVHVHPEPRPVDGHVKFWVAAPSSGTYRMFFDFQVAETVHTAAWTVVVP